MINITGDQIFENDPKDTLATKATKEYFTELFSKKSEEESIELKSPEDWFKKRYSEASVLDMWDFIMSIKAGFDFIKNCTIWGKGENQIVL